MITFYYDIYSLITDEYEWTINSPQDQQLKHQRRVWLCMRSGFFGTHSGSWHQWCLGMVRVLVIGTNTLEKKKQILIKYRLITFTM
jgi:hypothetical protein